MGFMDIIRKIGNPFKGLLQLPRIVKRVEPEEFVYGYDLYSEMPDGLLGARIPDEDNWFDESIYAVPSVPTETSIPVSYTHLTLPTTLQV